MDDNNRTLTLSEIVAGALRQSLHDGVYVCGERLVELTIAQEMHVSQNTVRDALRILEAEGWLVKKPRHGVYVRDFTVDDLIELYALRAALETLALGWACEEADLDALATLKTYIDAADEQVKMGNSYAAREELFNFHMSVVNLANKPQTSRILYRLLNQSRLMENIREKHMPRSVRQWRDIVAAYRALYDSLEDTRYNDAKEQIHAIIQRDGETLRPVLELAHDEDDDRRSPNSRLYARSSS